MDALLFDLAALDCASASWFLAAGDAVSGRFLLVSASLLLRMRRRQKRHPAAFVRGDPAGGD
jgi:hypothetical protein